MIWILLGLLTLLWPPTVSRADDFALVGKAIDAAIVHHFTTYRPSSAFAVVKATDSYPKKYEPLAPAMERAVVAGLGEAVRFLVPLKDLRFP